MAGPSPSSIYRHNKVCENPLPKRVGRPKEHGLTDSYTAKYRKWLAQEKRGRKILRRNADIKCALIKEGCTKSEIDDWIALHTPVKETAAERREREAKFAQCSEVFYRTIWHFTPPQVKIPPKESPVRKAICTPDRTKKSPMESITGSTAEAYFKKVFTERDAVLKVKKITDFEPAIKLHEMMCGHMPDYERLIID